MQRNTTDLRNYGQQQRYTIANNTMLLPERHPAREQADCLF